MTYSANMDIVFSKHISFNCFIKFDKKSVVTLFVVRYHLVSLVHNETTHVEECSRIENDEIK